MHIKLVQYEIFSMKLFSSTTEHPNIKYWVYMMHNQTKNSVVFKEFRFFYQVPQR